MAGRCEKSATWTVVRIQSARWWRRAGFHYSLTRRGGNMGKPNNPLGPERGTAQLSARLDPRAPVDCRTGQRNVGAI